MIFFAGLALIGHHMVSRYRTNLADRQAAIELQAAEAGARMSGMAQHLFRKQLPRSVDLMMSYASVSPDLELGVILDSDNVVRHATRQQWEGVELAKSPIAGEQEQVEKAKSRMEGILEIDQSRDRLMAFFPFWVRPDSRSKGVLVLQYSLTGPAAMAWHETLHDSVSQTFALLAGSLMLWLMLTQWSDSQRLQRVVEQARTLVVGGAPALPLEGEDELALFSRSFSDVADRIDETEQQFTQLAARIREVFWFVRCDRPSTPIVNSAYRQILERDPAVLGSRRWDWLRAVTREDRRRALEFLRDLSRGVEADPVEIRLAFEGWRFKWVECRGFLVPSAGGGIRAIGGVATDVSERKDLERRLIEAAEEERMRIGQDLHDDVCQRMAAAQLKGGILHNSLEKHGLPQAGLAAEVSADLAEATEIVRGFAHGLAPVALEAEGLVPALTQLADFVGKAFGVRCWAACTDPSIKLDSVCTTHIYRIAQELATNAARHARPVGIGITLSGNGRSMVLQVSNDGIPFDGNPGKSAGMGLYAVRKHVEALGGSISFKAGSGSLGGTTVTCEFPIPIRTRNHTG